MSLYSSPKEVTEGFSLIGAGKARKPGFVLVLLGIVAGMFIALGSAVTNTASYGITSPWIARTVSGLLFPFGLGMVVVTGAELFTGNSLIVISVLDGKCKLKEMFRNWGIVYISNFIGALLVAAGCAYFGQMNYSDGQLAVFTMKLAAAKCSLPFANGIVLGFFCNFLVCIGVLMATAAKDVPGKIMGAFLPVCYFVLCGFEHCVANMYYIPAGLMAKSIEKYAVLAMDAGIDLSALTVKGFIVGNLIPVTIGNIIGGIAVAAIMWYCHIKSNEKK